MLPQVWLGAVAGLAITLMGVWGLCFAVCMATSCERCSVLLLPLEKVSVREEEGMNGVFLLFFSFFSFFIPSSRRGIQKVF